MEKPKYELGDNVAISIRGRIEKIEYSYDGKIIYHFVKKNNNGQSTVCINLTEEDIVHKIPRELTERNVHGL